MSRHSIPAAAQDQLPPSAATHMPFSYLHGRLKDDRAAQFVALTMDVAQGLETCLEMVYSSTLTRELNADDEHGQEKLPLLNVADTDRIMRFAQVSARLLQGHAENCIEWMNKHGIKEGK